MIICQNVNNKNKHNNANNKQFEVMENNDRCTIFIDTQIVYAALYLWWNFYMLGGAGAFWVR